MSDPEKPCDCGHAATPAGFGEHVRDLYADRREIVGLAKKKAEPPRKPHSLHEFAWWYEDEKGITVVQEARRAADGGHLSTESVRIPWKRLLAAAQRCGVSK